MTTDKSENQVKKEVEETLSQLTALKKNETIDHLVEELADDFAALAKQIHTAQQQKKN
ncbi:hypothetical protein [Persicobacter psychrovividus]|uniref:Uncharacterized protein n=1 Tax=Persicobacter psychrovividus TaxID=387638 RepID=A0ABM7VEZ6_9BACT|nr:hypothetical protein PEPS_17910 [Persicobacter psychrovividus]